MRNQAKTTQHSTYELIGDVLNLVGSFAQLGKKLATSKIQSTANSANDLMQGKMDMPDLRAQLSSAADSLEAISDYAIHTDVKHMVDDVGVFARKHPIAALVSVVVAGAMFSRLVMKTPTASKATKRAVSKPKGKKVAAKVRRKAKANGAAQAHA